jgi:ADP-ribose pyrophosphatase YjhB (NUDIX family)
VREIAAVGAIIVRDGFLLLVQRGHAPAAGKWSVPGGRVEQGESDTQAVAREVAEETGLVVRVGPLLGEVSRAGVGDVVYRIRDYLVEIVAGSERAGDDAADLAWVPLEELADRDLTEGLLDTLRGWQVVPTPSGNGPAPKD